MSDQKNQQPLRIYADGVFDNFHIGHSNLFKQCREAFPEQKVWLIAGVCSQADVEKRKGTLSYKVRSNNKFRTRKVLNGKTMSLCWWSLWRSSMEPKWR